MEEQLKNIETFFKLNLEIKNLMLKCAPNDTDNYNMDSSIKYGDKLYFAIEDIKDMFIKLFNILNINHLSDYLDKLFKHYQEELLNCNYNFKKMKDFYQNNFSNMNPSLIDKIKDTFIGYYFFNSLETIIGEVKTINELLHVLHSYILNNEHIYQSMPVIQKRQILNGSPITLYGKKNMIAKNLFNNIPVDLFLGPTDIVAFDNKIIMMIRDLGHALSIEIDIENEKCMVKYFIPKICNPAMARELKGVNPIKDNVKFANGKFECNIEELGIVLYDFLGKVPTDKDMFTLGGWYYNEDAPARR